MSIDLNPQTLMQEAMDKEGLSDFGDNSFQEGLAVLLETYTSNNFSERGLKRQRRRVVDLLATRLRIEKALKDYPEISEQKIVKPMYLTGLPRTGTSALLNLLALDEDARPLKLWEGLMPDPCEGFKHGEDDPRYIMMRDWMDENNRKNPDFSKIHHTTADTPEECIHLLNHTFSDVQYGMETMLEPYGSWFMQQDISDSYNYYAKQLQMLQWQRPGKRWLLKSPAHLWALDNITGLFPDACIIITHRSPLEAVTSYASMMDSLMKERNYDKKTLGPVVMEYLAKKLEASLVQRESITKGAILDLQFNDFISDSVATVHKVYEHFDIEMTSKTQQRLEEYHSQNPMGKHGKHEYNLQEYGLTEQQVLDRFAFYIKRFDIPMK